MRGIFKFLFLGLAAAVFEARAAVDFDNYIPTLDRLYAQGQAPIDSDYSLAFTQTSQGGGDFAYSYAIGGGNGATYTSRIQAGNGGLPITGYFTGFSGGSYGGAIFLYGGMVVGDVAGDFIGNHASGAAVHSIGGAINVASSSVMGNITGDFIGNYASNSYASSGGVSYGGAINNEAVIGDITGNFIGNYAVSPTDSTVKGGAIHANSTSSTGIVSGSFIGNYAKAASAFPALGGAVFTGANMSFMADGVLNIFSGNYTEDPTRGKLRNAISLVSSSARTLAFSTANFGSFVFDDTIETISGYSGNTMVYSLHHAISLGGDGTGSVVFNNDLVNIGNMNVADTTLVFGQGPYGRGRFLASLDADGGANTAAALVTNLSLANSTFDIANGYLETVGLAGYSASGDTYLSLDVDPDLMSADVLSVDGDVSGATKLVVHAASNEDIRGRGEILFAESFNDTAGSASSFSVFRVYGSPYLYDVVYGDLGGNARTWSLAMNDAANPNYTNGGGKVDVAAEVVGYIGLHEAGVEQTRSMVSSVRGKVAANKAYCPGCGVYDAAYAGKPLSNGWISPVYHNASIGRPQKMEAAVYGLEGGFDVQRDANNKLGAFASYRNGVYNLNGKGEKYVSPVESSIDIDSWLGGLYYRYDRGGFWLFAAADGGIQRAALNTRDGVKTSSAGVQLGGEIDSGYLFALGKGFSLEPNIGISYTHLDFGEMSDKFGKTAKYDTLSLAEAKAGLRLEKAISLPGGAAKAWAEPGVVRVMAGGDRVRISGLGSVDTYDEGTLGRLELGGSYGISKQLSAFGMTSYTWGSGYNALSFGAGLNYAW